MKKILLLDEDFEARETFARVLRLRGYMVMPVQSASGALDALSSGRKPDLLIASATDRDRAELVVSIREQNPNLPVLLLSDYCEAEARFRSLVYGEFGKLRRLNIYLNLRPVTLRELDRLMRIVLGRTGPTRLRLQAA